MGTLVSGKEHKSSYESHPDYLLRVMPAGRHVRVTVDDELLTCEPAKSVPLAQRYFLF